MSDTAAALWGWSPRQVIDRIEEYARHVGHADLIRESVDGPTGEDPTDSPYPYGPARSVLGRRQELLATGPGASPAASARAASPRADSPMPASSRWTFSGAKNSAGDVTPA
jgi:uncharacterized protein DUF664